MVKAQNFGSKTPRVQSPPREHFLKFELTIAIKLRTFLPWGWHGILAMTFSLCMTWNFLVFYRLFLIKSLVSFLLPTLPWVKESLQETKLSTGEHFAFTSTFKDGHVDFNSFRKGVAGTLIIDTPRLCHFYTGSPVPLGPLQKITGHTQGECHS